MSNISVKAVLPVAIQIPVIFNSTPENEPQKLGSYISWVAKANTCIKARPVNQKINPDLLYKTWKVRWIFHPSASGTAYRVFHLRKTFDLNHAPENFIIHVSADNRYRLFVNGNPVSSGPGDQVTASLYPWGWEQPAFDDFAWLRAGAIHNSGIPRGFYDYSDHSGWNLVHREIPLHEEKNH